MPLLDLKTDLKSLKFGKDRPDGGSSNQPFVTKKIPDDRKPAVISDGGPDFMLRGGVLAPIRAVDDAVRTTKLFLETPKGLLFTAKMNLLSRMAPKTLAAQGAGYAGGNINQGAYLPSSLIAQTGLAFTGTHTNTFGLNPFSPGQLDPSLTKQLASGGLVRYESAILGIGGNGEGLTGGLISPLSGLYDDKILVKTSDPNVLSYSGGPGAYLGIGNTDIKFGDQRISRTGINNPISLSDENYFFVGGATNSRNLDLFISPFSKTDYKQLLNAGDDFDANVTSDGGITWNNLSGQRAYQQGTLTPSTDLPTPNRPNSNTVDDFKSPLSTNYAEVPGFGGSNGEYTNNVNSSGGFTWENIDVQNVYADSGSLEPNEQLPPSVRPNGQSTDDFIDPLSTNYANIEGFGGENGNYEDNISKDGGYTWNNVDARRIYNSGSLTPIDNEITLAPQTTDDWVAPFVQLPTPAGPTSYESLLNDGTPLNDVTNDGDLAWNDAQQNNTTAIRGNTPNTALMFNNNTVEVRARYKGINIFAEEGVGEGDELLFRGLPIATKYPISNGFVNLSNTGFNPEENFNTGIARYMVNGGVGQGVYKNSIAFGEEESDAIETNVEFINETGNGVSTWTQGDFEALTDSDLHQNTQQIRDFRADISDISISPDSTKKVLSKFNADYNTKRIDIRTNVGDPGARRNVQNYSVGGQQALDKITASPIYEAVQATHTGEKNDLVKFSIGYIQNNNSGNSNFMNFRAYITDFSDNYTADWGETQYAGRGDKFYNYKGFGRSISMGFKMYATSKAELIPMYKKLNFLASGLAPTYSGGGFMQGNLSRITVGGYLYNQLGFIKSLSYTIPKESTWEIGLSSNGGLDSSVKELPHMIDVTGLEFQPIQEFVPRIGNPLALGETPYIALSNGENTNY